MDEMDEMDEMDAWNEYTFTFLFGIRMSNKQVILVRRELLPRGYASTQQKRLCI